jgi:hypothetical protein
MLSNQMNFIHRAQFPISKKENDEQKIESAGENSTAKGSESRAGSSIQYNMTIQVADDDFSDFCMDCGTDHLKGQPLGVGIFDHSGPELLLRVWLTTKGTGPSGETFDAKVIAIARTGCEIEARFLANSVRALLDTQDGQRQAVEFAKHGLGDDHTRRDEPSEAAREPA